MCICVSSGRGFGLGLAAVLACAVVAGGGAGAQTGFDFSNSLVPEEAFVSGGVPRDGIPSIDQPRLAPPSQSGGLADSALVVGVEIDGDARAYPLSILNRHEIANDEVGGTPVAVTWCPLTASAVVFARNAEFGVSGLLYNSNLVLYDRATESLWPQLAGRALAGPQAGTELRRLPAVVLSWGVWRARYTDSRVLAPPAGAPGDYGRDPYAGYHRSSGTMFPVSTPDARLPAKAKVLGVRIGNTARAYPMEAIQRAAEGMLEDEIAGRVLRVYPAGANTAYAADAEGNTLTATPAYWFAWSAFNPDTGLYVAPVTQ